MKFLLQSEFKNEAFITLQRAQDYHYWKCNGSGDIFKLYQITDKHPLLNQVDRMFNPKEWCPVGSVEFVHNYYKEHFGLELKPINVPEELFSFAGRKIKNISGFPLSDCFDEIDFVEDKPWFIKSNDFEKWKENDEYHIECIERLPSGNYQASEIIDIKSEWRCFVHDGQLLSPHFYQGDSWMIPALYRVEDMVDAYKNSPTTYTLDVAVAYIGSELKTVVLEVHDFYACGLYGFQDLEKLPFMYWRSHLDKINKLNENTEI